MLLPGCDVYLLIGISWSITSHIATLPSKGRQCNSSLYPEGRELETLGEQHSVNDQCE